MNKFIFLILIIIITLNCTSTLSVEKSIKNFKEFTIKPKDDELVSKEEDVWIVEYHFVTVVAHSAI